MDKQERQADDIEAGHEPCGVPEAADYFLMRLQLETSTIVTTLRHTSVRVTDAIGRHLLMLLDGTRDKQALLAELGKLMESGQVVMQREGKEILEAREAMKVLTDELEQNLVKIARLALLVA